MTKLLFTLSVIMVLSGCGTNGQETESRENPPTLTQTHFNEEIPSDEDMIIGARNQITLNLEDQLEDKEYYSKEEAKLLVEKHLNRQKNDSSTISFEGFKDNHYLFRVYDLVHFNNKPEKLTRGWYRVSPESGKISAVKKDS
ncbi:hypothetical protein [Sutcliffiella deserti]|uniref:hypothetical protein n=1 Tax=Sutcliffiella deserti TaxID=2875501 RepID=UPI001CC187B3|nr:hypothetical protein [Sutcliffiella deserti]